MTEEEYKNATILEQILYDETGMYASDNPSIATAMEKYNIAMSEHDKEDTRLTEQTKRYIDLAYLTGVFNVSGIDGLSDELARLKAIDMKPHNIYFPKK